ncbi:Unknown protein [Striga hermonthica]|uniref:CBF1-interacting co-repressor CIR N-terminal domain-containing protein n=1 Tax=Striga hermonthica TaxID=68872 RepID=A0A9N7R9H0_STRHE|nr:Unknown protein [Striga hermonthica]
MALKFLNKKGWHTGSLRNVENVWKAEQKHEAEQRKLEELRKQIHEERERAEFRQLQEQAGLIPKQERLDFLYESGLAVGKGSSSFKALESLPKTEPDATASTSSASAKQSAVPGALFEEKSQSANDAWRKLHSDPLLLIRQREQEALARVKNNPVQMAMIRKSVQAEKEKDIKKHKKKHHHRKKSKHRSHSSENESDHEKQRRNHHNSSKPDKPSSRRAHSSFDEETSREDARRRKYREKNDDRHKSKTSDHYTSQHQETRGYLGSSSDRPPRPGPYDSSKPRKPVKLSEEERAARLREMQTDAEIHEQQRWKRLKKAADSEAREAVKDQASVGRNFLDSVQKSVYGAEKGGSKSIEESVRRRMHYSQGRSAAESNAFRRS